MKPTRFILIRHGETAANREFRYIGRRDDPLTDLGRNQASSVAAALAPYPLAAIYSSPRQRAAHTALTIAALHQLEVVTSNELREENFGLWEGFSRDEVATQYPEELAAWEDDASFSPPGGESVADMHLRVQKYVHSLIALHEGQTVALVSHVGPIKAIICATLKSPPQIARRLFLDPATISVVDWRPQDAVLRLYNEHAHLGIPRWFHL